MEYNKVSDITLSPELFEKLDDSENNAEKMAYESSS